EPPLERPATAPTGVGGESGRGRGEAAGPTKEELREVSKAKGLFLLRMRTHAGAPRGAAGTTRGPRETALGATGGPPDACPKRRAFPEKEWGGLGAGQLPGAPLPAAAGAAPAAAEGCAGTAGGPG